MWWTLMGDRACRRGDRSTKLSHSPQLSGIHRTPGPRWQAGRLETAEGAESTEILKPPTFKRLPLDFQVVERETSILRSLCSLRFFFSKRLS